MRNPATRHMPVHAVSVEDFSRQALSLGAIGYALKPVKREQLMATFEKLQSKLQQGLRRVLIVEDDANTREATRRRTSGFMGRRRGRRIRAASGPREPSERRRRDLPDTPAGNPPPTLHREPPD